MPRLPTPVTPNQERDMRDLDEQGVPRAQIARQLGIPRQVVTRILGPKFSREEGNVREYHIYCRPENFDDVANMARDFGLTNRGGQKAGKGSIGKLIDAIAEGRFVIAPNGTQVGVG